MFRVIYVDMDMREKTDLNMAESEQGEHHVPHVQDYIILQKSDYHVRYMVREVVRVYEGVKQTVYVKLIDDKVHPGKFE